MANFDLNKFAAIYKQERLARAKALHELVLSHLMELLTEAGTLIQTYKEPSSPTPAWLGDLDYSVQLAHEAGRKHRTAVLQFPKDPDTYVGAAQDLDYYVSRIIGILNRVGPK